MKWGNYEIELISDGTLRLDGGAMFGVVPKVIWERVYTPDDKNRIRLGLNCLLVRADWGNLLIDTGCGRKYSEKEIRIYQIEHETSLLGELERFGLGPQDIDVVINTHLHFDHAGGNTEVRRGEVHPVFPRARHFVQRREFEDAEAPSERTRASYFRENWAPLVENGRLELIEGEQEIRPGIFCEPTPGHTAGHQSVRIESGGRTLYYLADLCPTSRHIPLAWIMGYDLYPLTTLESRQAVYRRALDGEWTLFFEHDAERPLGRLRYEEGRYFCEAFPWTGRDGASEE